jgi:hypothetical protein
MLPYLLLALILARIKGYRLKPVLKAYPLYPYAFAEIFYLFLQANIFMHNYSFIKYTAILTNFYLYTLIIPVMFYKLYKPGIIGSLLIITGTFLNKFVINQNGGKMPVYATLSKLTGYYDQTAIGSADNLHVIGDVSVKYKYLTDFIDTGSSILSVGDLLIHSFIFIIIFYSIKEINLTRDQLGENRDRN